MTGFSWQLTLVVSKQKAALEKTQGGFFSAK